MLILGNKRKVLLSGLLATGILLSIVACSPRESSEDTGSQIESAPILTASSENMGETLKDTSDDKFPALDSRTAAEGELKTDFSPEHELTPEKNKENESMPEENTANDKIKITLPIEDEFVALDMVKDYLNLEDFETIPNGSGGYTYKKGIYELFGNGHYTYKKTGEKIFCVDFGSLNSDKESIYRYSQCDTYAVFQDTGTIKKISSDDFE